MTQRGTSGNLLRSSAKHIKSHKQQTEEQHSPATPQPLSTKAAGDQRPGPKAALPMRNPGLSLASTSQVPPRGAGQIGPSLRFPTFRPLSQSPGRARPGPAAALFGIAPAIPKCHTNTWMLCHLSLSLQPRPQALTSLQFLRVGWVES